MTNAIVLGGTHADKSKLIYGKNKAFLEVKGKPIILNVLNALQNAESIDKIAVVGPRKDLEKIVKRVQVIEESKAPKESRRFIENAIHSYNTLSPNGEKTLFICSDLPFICSETIDDFVSRCNSGATFYFGLINVNNVPKKLEEFKKSAGFCLSKGLLKKEYYRTANLSLFEGSKIKNKSRELFEAEIEKAFPRRRTASKYAKFRLYCFLFKKYPFIILRYLTNSLKEEHIESSFKKKMGLCFKITETKDPRTWVDVDYEEEYEFIRDNFDKLKEEYGL